MKYVLDTSAIMAFFLDEKGSGIVERILTGHRDSCCVHSVNWIELYYKMHNRGGEKAAKTSTENLRLLAYLSPTFQGRTFSCAWRKSKSPTPSFPWATVMR